MKIQMGSGRTFYRVRKPARTPEQQRRRDERRAERDAHRSATYWAQNEAARQGLGARLIAWLCPDKS